MLSVYIWLAVGLVLVVFVGLFLHRVRTLKAPLLYAYGLYEFARSIQILSGQLRKEGLIDKEDVHKQYPTWSGEPFLNRHIHLTKLSTPSSRAVTAPNNDTLYTSAILDLSTGPVELIVPDATERYLSVAFMDMFNDQIAYIGTRATKGKGGVYWLVRPGQQASPSEGVQRIDFPVNDLWMLARVFVSGTSDLDAARELQRQIRVCPLDPSNKGVPFQTKATSARDPKNVLAVINELLARSPQTGHSQRATQWSAFGIQPGNVNAFDTLPLLTRLAWSLLTAHVERLIVKRIDAQQSAQAGWMTPPPILGQYGTQDDIRAAVSLIGFGALTVDEAMYFRAMTDHQGRPLDGQQTYRMRIPAEGVPVDAFWSLSMYKPDETKRLYFYENEIDRYAINSASQDLTYQENGDILLAIQPHRPDDPTLVWLPTPAGAFQMIFRTYLPKQEIISGQWQVPEVKMLPHTTNA